MKKESLVKNIYKTIIQIWKNRSKIFEGIRYKHFPTFYVERIAKERQAVCEVDACGYYDPLGKSPKAFFPGKPTCGACGCRLSWKQHSLSSDCGLTELGKEPLWIKRMEEVEEEIFRANTGLKND